MKIAYVSDLHVDINGLPELTAEADVLVLAGDICPSDYLEDVMVPLCAQYERVMYVSGNHELYLQPGGAQGLKEQIEALGLLNLHYLENDTVTFDGQRFVGCTMWFPYNGNATGKHQMNDFRYIERFEEFVGVRNKESQVYLRRNLQQGDIVITHHLPSYNSVAPHYVGHPLNRFFVCPMDDIIETAKPAYWFHGHTHTSCDYKLGDTRVLCNPMGYKGENKSSYDPTKVLEIK